MTPSELKTAKSTARPKSSPRRGAEPETSSFQCLVVSATPERQEMLARAARQSGWQATICGDPAEASAYINVRLVQLALVDVEAQELDDYGGLLEKLAHMQGLLLVVCGNDGATDEEMFVRQIGAWLYLPGVAEGSDLSMLCGEARRVVEKLAPTTISIEVARPTGGARNRTRRHG